MTVTEWAGKVWAKLFPAYSISMRLGITFSGSTTLLKSCGCPERTSTIACFAADATPARSTCIGRAAAAVFTTFIMTAPLDVFRLAVANRDGIGAEAGEEDAWVPFGKSAI